MLNRYQLVRLWRPRLALKECLSYQVMHSKFLFLSVIIKGTLLSLYFSRLVTLGADWGIHFFLVQLTIHPFLCSHLLHCPMPGLLECNLLLFIPPKTFGPLGLSDQIIPMFLWNFVSTKSLLTSCLKHTFVSWWFYEPVDTCPLACLAAILLYNFHNSLREVKKGTIFHLYILKKKIKNLKGEYLSYTKSLCCGGCLELIQHIYNNCRDVFRENLNIPWNWPR